MAKNKTKKYRKTRWWWVRLYVDTSSSRVEDLKVAAEHVNNFSKSL